MGFTGAPNSHSLSSRGIDQQRVFGIQFLTKLGVMRDYNVDEAAGWLDMLKEVDMKNSNVAATTLLATEHQYLMAPKDYHEKLALSIVYIDGVAANDNTLTELLKNFQNILGASGGSLYAILNKRMDNLKSNMSQHDKEELEKGVKGMGDPYYRIPTDITIYMLGILNGMWFKAQTDQNKNRIADIMMSLIKRNEEIKKDDDARQILYAIEPWGGFFYDYVSEKLWTDPDTTYRHFHNRDEVKYLSYYLSSQYAENKKTGHKIHVRGATVNEVKSLFKSLISYYEIHPELDFDTPIENKLLSQYAENSEKGNSVFRGLSSQNPSVDLEFVRRSFESVSTKEEAEDYVRKHYKGNVGKFVQDADTLLKTKGYTNPRLNELSVKYRRGGV